MPDQIQRIFTGTLIIGSSGQGKTSLAPTFAEYLWETYRKVLLFYSCDAGAFPTRVQLRVRQGLMRAWRMRTRSAEGLAFETCYLASKGYWPRHINPETGETDPAVQLVPPVTAKYALACREGHPLKVVPSVSLITGMICPQCKTMAQPPDMRIQESVNRTKGFEQVGGVFYDGLTSMSGWFMSELDVSRGHGFIGGEKPPLGGTVLSGSVKFGGNNRADYGFAQTRAYQVVHNALSIPNLVEGPIFTALTDEVSEGGGQLPIVGPKLAGSALTAEALPWFGNALETRIEKSEKDWDVRRLYLSEFVDAQNRRHLLKNSGPGTLPRYLEDPPINPQAPDPKLFFVGFNLGNFFRLLDQALADQLAGEDATATPGIAAAPSDYGEPMKVETPEPAASTSPTSPPGSPTPAPAAGTSAPNGPPIATPRRRAAPATPTATAPTPAAPSAPPTGTASPPPPGMRPPQKAPGS